MKVPFTRICILVCALIAIVAWLNADTVKHSIHVFGKQEISLSNAGQHARVRHGDAHIANDPSPPNTSTVVSTSVLRRDLVTSSTSLRVARRVVNAREEASCCVQPPPTSPTFCREQSGQCARINDAIQSLAKARCSYSKGKSSLRQEAAIIHLGYAPEQRVEGLMQAYNHHFGHSAFTGSQIRQSRKNLNDGVSLWRCNDGRTGTGRYSSFVCVAWVIDWIRSESSLSHINGFTYFHADLWLHPAYLYALLSATPNSIIGVAQGFRFEKRLDYYEMVVANQAKRCGSPMFNRNFGGLKLCLAKVGTRFDRHVCKDREKFSAEATPRGMANRNMIHMNGPDGMIGTFQDVDKAFYSNLPSLNDTLCYGWSDLYRIPRNAWNEFYDIAIVFAKKPEFQDSYHEIVVPTAMMKIARNRGRNVTMLPCWGGALNEVKADFSWSIVDVLPCGHKLELSRSGVLPTLINAMKCG